MSVQWSAIRRYSLAIAIFVIALLLRLALLPVPAGLEYLIFYPGLMLVFLLCGVGPGALMTVLSTAAAYHIFSPPYGSFGYGLVATTVFLLSSVLLALIVRSLHFHIESSRLAAARIQSAVDELRQSERRYRAVVQDQTEVICRYRCDDTLVFVNDAFCRLVGKSSDELVGHKYSLTFPEDLARVKSELSRLSPVNPVVTVENRILTSTGEVRWCQFVHRALFDGSGTLIETQSVARDITEHKRLEDDLKQARDSVAQANEVKSRFLAAASHDLRQPLQTIWSLQAVLTRVFKDSGYGPQLALLGEAVHTMDHMLSALIDINRLEMGAIQPVIRDFPLREILPRLRSEFGYAAAGKLLALDIADSPEFVCSDAMLLPVILRNLIGNAIKYTKAGMVRLRVRSQGAHIIIDVMDSGPGIPQEHLKRLCDAFYAVDKSSRDQRRGVGLGLSIVQTICRLLNHTVSIHSSVGEGSTFSIQLERGVRADLPTESIPTPAFIPAPHSGGFKKILHIEDDPSLARSMAMLLSLEGYEVTGAASRDEALQQVAEYGLRPDLILCDFQLPMGFTGDGIVAEIAARLKFKPPTVMLTGDIANRHIKKAELIADRILPKPVDVNVLLREFDALLGARQ